ncbi:hypothetical protein J3Q64DRAFT_1770116 [Phycomyces blakesleeanus]|uniref:Major facilitator superfamily (MFS) profile domain-containing protein n=1 Tax=Phycomyces blakesleeanus TaxID=4837 RepID=A0ABR3ALI3_PHYBL
MLIKAIKVRKLFFFPLFIYLYVFFIFSCTLGFPYISTIYIASNTSSTSITDLSIFLYISSCLGSISALSSAEVT